MNPLIRKVVFFFVLSFCMAPLISQTPTDREFIQAVKNANYYYSTEDYNRAASLFKILCTKYPENSNLATRLGICYLHVDGKRNEALLLLKKATENVAESEKEFKEFGEKAPPDVYLYLAHAYQINDSLEKSFSLFKEIKNKLKKNDAFKEEYINKQISDCKYAMEMIKKPLTIVSNLFTPWLKEYSGACNPVLSKNDSVFVFTVEQNGKTSIYCSYKQGAWKTPVNITSQLGGYDRLYSNSITGDGSLLVLFMDDGEDGNLYFSQRKDTTWTRIKSFGKQINTIYWESHGFITPDGKTLYFASNRPGGEGELDIWVSEKADDGTWKRPVNCGNVINTPYNENTPFFDPSSNTLLFSSEGHLSMGGYDVLRSTYKNGLWSNPIGIPYAFNNTLENTFFILNNNAPGYITSLYNDKTKSRNIYSIIAKDPTDEITLAKGSVILMDGINLNPDKAQMTLINTKTPTQFQDIPLSDSGTFKFEIKPGDYQLFVSYAGYKTDTIYLNLPLYFSGNYISVIVSLEPEKVFLGDFLSATNILFKFDSFELSDQGKFNLEILKSNLIEYPSLTVNVKGYTDDIGSTEYNKILAEKRAQAVIDYLTSAGISPTRFTKKEFGESNFIEVNNKDGMANPEGRKNSRRASVGIINPQNGIILNQKTYTPEHLRQPYSMKYNIILIKTTEKLPQDYFSNLAMNNMLYVNPVKKDSVFWYVLGIFYNKPDAIEYLSLARDKGLKDAYIINQYDLNNELKSTDTTNSGSKQTIVQKVFTIQLVTSKQPLNMSLIFKKLAGVMEMHGDDGLYKYTYGEYASITEAKTALIPIQESGFKEAVIVEINLLIHKNK